MKNLLKNCTFAVGLSIATTLALTFPIQAEVEPSAEPLSQFQNPEWRLMNATEEAEALNYILESPLGIAALNQLAIEGFISPVCEKRF